MPTPHNEAPAGAFAPIADFTLLETAADMAEK